MVMKTGLKDMNNKEINEGDTLRMIGDEPKVIKVISENGIFIAQDTRYKTIRPELGKMLLNKFYIITK